MLKFKIYLYYSFVQNTIFNTKFIWQSALLSIYQISSVDVKHFTFQAALLKWLLSTVAIITMATRLNGNTVNEIYYNIMRHITDVDVIYTPALCFNNIHLSFSFIYTARRNSTRCTVDHFHCQ